MSLRLSLVVSLFLSFLLFGANPVFAAKGWQLDPDPGAKFEFLWQSSDGELALPCKHYVENELPIDWKVVCGIGTPLRREFLVHLIVRSYHREARPSQALEILYWVVNRTGGDQNRYTSATTWMEFEEPSALYRMHFSQGVENDVAQLRLFFKP
ncbi:MAG: hypothetical protein NDJ90_07635 [Oligoflexia bacterium]|nr:hypothetical protein [Oligoflexia bacterium]